MINQTAIDTLVAKWAEPNGIPFKGSLISKDGCMCAQGQALHYIGGWDNDRLRGVRQSSADRETAKLLGISVAHAILLRQINDSLPESPSVVLANPEVVLGDQAQTVLAFWRHLDRMTADDWRKVAATWSADRGTAGDSARYSARSAARDAARGAIWDAARDAARDAAGSAAWDAAWAAAGNFPGDAAGAAAGATNEIQGAAIMRGRSQPFACLLMFGFADPEVIF